ncbi:MAG: prolyl oligopeptidase family serine peptidase [Niabella sp.]
MKKIIIILLVLLAGQQIGAQDFSQFQKFWFAQSKETLPYRILLPENYNPQQKYPLVLFLHGSGESGNDNELQLVHGARLFLDEQNRKQYPAIVVFPQNALNSSWSNMQTVSDEKGERSFYFVPGGTPSTSMRLLTSLVDNLFKQYKIRRDQVYVMGLSMGGMGTFEIVNRMPGMFAAAVPICGGASTATAANLKGTAWWVFHGAKDDVVLPKYSEEMVKAMKRNGVNVKFTLYPDANHNSWDSAFAEPGLLKWLFAQKKKVQKLEGER